MVPGADSRREASAVARTASARRNRKADHDRQQPDGRQRDQALCEGRRQGLRSLDQLGERLPNEVVEVLWQNAVGICVLPQVHEEGRPFLVPQRVAGLLARSPLEVPDVPFARRRPRHGWARRRLLGRRRRALDRRGLGRQLDTWRRDRGSGRGGSMGGGRSAGAAARPVAARPEAPRPAPRAQAGQLPARSPALRAREDRAGAWSPTVRARGPQ